MNPVVNVLPLLTPRLRLRALCEADVGDLHRVYADPLVEAWIGHHTREDVAEEVRVQVAHQAEHGWALWAVQERATNRFLGDCGLQPFEHRGPEVELGYDLHPVAWGRGLATEAARATLDVAFGPLGLDRVVAVVKPQNLASRRVLQKAGFARIDERAAYGERMLLYEVTAPSGP